VYKIEYPDVIIGNRFVEGIEGSPLRMSGVFCAQPLGFSDISSRAGSQTVYIFGLS
jgi:hypothetical protein